LGNHFGHFGYRFGRFGNQFGNVGARFRRFGNQLGHFWSFWLLVCMAIWVSSLQPPASCLPACSQFAGL
jgi:hypothetical protein